MTSLTLNRLLRIGTVNRVFLYSIPLAPTRNQKFLFQQRRNMAKGNGTKRSSEDVNDNKKDKKLLKNSDVEPPKSETMSCALYVCLAKLLSLYSWLDRSHSQQRGGSEEGYLFKVRKEEALYSLLN